MCSSVFFKAQNIRPAQMPGAVPGRSVAACRSRRKPHPITLIITLHTTRLKPSLACRVSSVCSWFSRAWYIEKTGGSRLHQTFKLEVKPLYQTSHQSHGTVRG